MVEDSGMTCAHCGENSAPDARTCGHCGQPLTPADADAAFDRLLAAVTPRAYVTPALMAANLIVFAVMAARGVSAVQPPAGVLIEWGAVYGPAITHGEWWRLFTGMFVHAGAIHLAFNLLALFSIGMLTERLFGNAAFLIVYTAAGLGGAVLGLYWHPVAASVGASGAIFGLYGALFVFLLRQRARIPRHFVRSVGFGAATFLVYNLVYGLADAGIDNEAHIGGLIAGAFAGLALARPLEPAPLGRRVRRNTLVAAASLAALGALAARVPAVDDFLAGLASLSRVEQKAQATVNTLLGQLRDGKISEGQFADTVEQEVLPPWRAQRQALAKMRLPNRERDLTSRAVRYMDLRAQAWALGAEGIRSRDSGLIDKGNITQAAANQAAAEFARAANPRATSTPAPMPPVVAKLENAALQQEFQRFQGLEARAAGQYNEAVAGLRSKKLSNTAFADRIEDTVLPEWDAQYRRLLAVHATGADDARRAQLAEYMRLRGEGWRLTAQGVRTGSPALLKDAAAAEAQAVALLQPASGRGQPGQAPPGPGPRVARPQ
jgi:rhomboid protease GluP